MTCIRLALSGCLLAGAVVGGSSSSLVLAAEMTPGQIASATAWPSRAQWIGLDDVKSVWPAAGKDPQGHKDDRTYLPATYLRKGFEVAGKVRKAVLRVTALGIVVPYLNGERVGKDYFTPGWSSYRKRLYWREYDVTRQVKEGPNALGALLGDGWFRGNVAWKRGCYGQRTRAKVELELTMQDGRTVRVGSDASWKASTGAVLEGDFHAGETYDARLEAKGWAAAGFDDAAWKPVAGGADFEPAVYEAHPGPAVEVVAEIPAQTVTEPKPGVYVFDLGQNFAGIARLRVEEPAGTKIVMKFGEMLNADGTVYRENLRTARAIDTYICRGGGVETWSPLLTSHGFRYVEVTGPSKRPEPGLVTGLVLTSAMRRTGDFACSDALITRIYKNTWWGQLSNYLEVPTDCPQRNERMGWSGDTQEFSRTGLYNADASAFLAKWVTDQNDDQGADGHYPDVAPAIRGMCDGWSPAWGDSGIVVPDEIWRATGDLAPVRRHWEGMKKFLAFYAKVAPDGIGPDHGYGDWLAIGMKTPRPLIVTAYYAHDCELMARLAEAQGLKEDAAAYSKRFQEVAAAFRAKFVAADGKIGEDSTTGYLLALRFNLLTPEQRPVCAARLAKAIEDHPDRMCGFVGVNLLLPTLQDIGRTDLAYRLLQKKTYPGWGYSIEQGATTMWERWNSYTKDKGFGDVGMNSFNHYAYGSCVEWLYEGILGIQPASPGYAEILVAPQIGGGLSWAKGSYDSPRGRISVSWRVEGDKATVEVASPQGVPCTVVLPDGTRHARNGGPAVFTCPIKR